jgi:predicted N-formylglutamate amidohydrolase
VLQSHRGFDAGAGALAQALGAAAGVVPHLGEVSRLVVDLNRSAHHPKLFSPVTRALTKQARQELLQRYWLPHRQRIEAAIAACHQRAPRCHHLAMHSFTPIWQGHVRAVDIGLLYDPKSAPERLLADALARALAAQVPLLQVRRNQPYRGTSDGLPTALRGRFGRTRYAGLEIEVNQALVHNRRAWPQTLRRLVQACQSGLDHFIREHESF